MVLISFEGQINDGAMPPPSAWVVPYPDMGRFLRHYRMRTNVSRSEILRDGAEYENAWWLIAGDDA